MPYLLLASFGLALVAIAIAIYQGSKTPRDSWFTTSTPSAQQQARDEQAIKEGKAIHLPARQREALLELFWIGLWAAPLFFIVSWLKQPENKCQTVFGIYAWNLVLIAVPPLLLYLTFTLMRDGVEIIRTGYYPPPSRPSLHDRVARKGKLATLRGWGALATALMLLYALVGDGMALYRHDNSEYVVQLSQLLQKQCAGDDARP
jgi:hypothetical protein